MMIRFSFFSVVAFSIVLFAPFVQAHSGGASFEEKIGEYFIDIGYDPAAPTAGENILLDLNLWKEKDISLADFDSAWVRLEQGGKTILATGVARPEFGTMTVSLKLPSEPGEMTLHVRFEEKGSTEPIVAEKSFTFPIAPSPSAPLPPLVWAIVGFGVGAVVVFLMRRLA